MANDIFECARAFKEISGYNYLFTVGRSKQKINISLKCLTKEFTHIVGLDHLSDIKELSTHNLDMKSTAFNSIIRGELTDEKIKSSQHFEEPFRTTYNSSTNSEYTLIERINTLKNIEDILNTAYTGKFYKWNSQNSRIKLPNGKIKQSSINAAYMLAIPSKTNKQEMVYFFMYEDKRPRAKNDNNDIKQLNVFSAFPDCLDLSGGQERPYTILVEEIESIKDKQKKTLFVHKNYVE